MLASLHYSKLIGSLFNTPSRAPVLLKASTLGRSGCRGVRREHPLRTCFSRSAYRRWMSFEGQREYRHGRNFDGQSYSGDERLRGGAGRLPVADFRGPSKVIFRRPRTRGLDVAGEKVPLADVIWAMMDSRASVLVRACVCACVRAFFSLGSL